MATWPKENVVIPRVNGTTLADLTGETIQVMEVNGTYPTNAISCNPGSGAAHRYKPASDLDTTKEYYVYAGGSIVDRIKGPDVASTVVDDT